jgi:NAD(P)-dependent dehydrogenase (short-subunit alcohol dehydrogenase family)
MPKAYWVSCYRSISDPAALADYAKLAAMSPPVSAPSAARQTGSAIGSMRNIAVAALTKNLAEELGPHGIDVTCVHPGITRTERAAGTVAARASAAGKTPEEIERAMAANTLIGRSVSTEEVAAIVTFLASPRSIAITGDAIACGGGARGAIHY